MCHWILFTLTTLPPFDVLVEVDTVNIDEPEPVIVVGLNHAVAPLGRPFAASVTLLVNPFKADTLTV